MKPLAEQATFTSNDERALAELVQSAVRYEPSPFRKRLIRTRIHAGARSNAAPGLRLIGVAALLVCTSAAAATIGYRFVTKTDDAAGDPAPRPVAPKADSVAVQPPEPEATAEQAPAPEEATAAPERSQVPRSHANAERDRAKPSGEDPSLMLEAVRALRKEGNPDHAQKLLDSYLSSHPSGALSEDALALSIEAATARKDPRAIEYARRYLAQYPNGRFRQLAQRAIAAER